MKTASALWVVGLPPLFIGVYTLDIPLPEFLAPVLYGTGSLGMIFDILIGAYLFAMVSGILKLKRRGRFRATVPAWTETRSGL